MVKTVAVARMAREVKRGMSMEVAELGAPPLAGFLDPSPGRLEDDGPVEVAMVSGIFPSAKEAPHMAVAPDVRFPVPPEPAIDLPFMGIEAIVEFIAIPGMDEVGVRTVTSACPQSLHTLSLGILERTGVKLLTPSVKKPLTSVKVSGRPAAFSALAKRSEAHRV